MSRSSKSRPNKQRTQKPRLTARSTSRNPRAIQNRQPRLIAFSAFYLGVALLAVIQTRNTEFAFYLVSLAVIIAAVLWLDRRIQFSPAVMWCLSIWAALHLAGGLMPLPPGWPYDGDHAVWYSGWIIPGILKYDHLVHAFGFGTAAVAALQGMRPSSVRYTRPSLGQAISASLVGCGLGSVNEILEFIATRISPETNVGGYENTAFDLVSNLVGTVLAMAVVKFVR